jgi:energy-converting hydrogenase A subunit M
MDNDEKLKLMKSRIVDSSAWRKDVIIPLARDFDVSEEEIDEVLFKDMDMSSLSNLHSTYETAIFECLIKRLHIDLNLCWIQDTLNLISEEDSNNLKLKLASEVNNEEDYKKVLKNGRKELFDILKF